jgi:hypothetical protein
VVDVTTAAMVLIQDQTVYALRTNQNISSGVGQYNTLTFADGTTDAERGGLITTGTPTIATNLRFGTTGTKEGIIYTAGNTILSGDIYAGSITKFGGSTLTIAKDQTAAANGTGFAGNWTVNGGALTLNTFGASGDGGTITLNASGITSGSGTTLNLSAAPGSTLNGQYTMGRIIAVDNAIVAATPGTDTAIGIGALEVHWTLPRTPQRQLGQRSLRPQCWNPLPHRRGQLHPLHQCQRLQQSDYRGHYWHRSKRRRPKWQPRPHQVGQRQPLGRRQQHQLYG